MLLAAAGTIPAELAGLARLEFIGARGGQKPDSQDVLVNQLSGTIPNELGSALRNLFTLHLGGNDLSGTMPANICDLISSGNLKDGCQLDGNPFDCPLPPCGKYNTHSLKTCIANCIGPG